MKRIKLNAKQYRPVVSAAFPQYKGRTVNIEFRNTLTFNDTNWGGGSHNSYATVSADGKARHLIVPAPWGNAVEGKTVEMPTNVLVVEHSIFCGQDCGITIYAHPCHMPKWLE